VYSVSMFNDIEILFTECKVDKMPLFVLYYFSLVPNTYLSIVSNSPKISLSISLPPFPLHYPPLAQDFSKFQKLPAFLPSPGIFLPCPTFSLYQTSLFLKYLKVLLASVKEKIHPPPPAPVIFAPKDDFCPIRIISLNFSFETPIVSRYS